MTMNLLIIDYCFNDSYISLSIKNEFKGFYLNQG
jgi:hypothetical protein